MKKVFSKTAFLILFIFSSAFLADAFFCEDNQASTHTQVPAHCCVQCCPAHNLAPSPQNIIVVKNFNLIFRHNLNLPHFYFEAYPNSIYRPPILS